jgi:hypothetical protein
MLTKSGAKLLDFGLARTRPVRSAGERGGELSLVATAMQSERRADGQGTIIGRSNTWRRAAEGTEADARTDIFSLGAVCTRWPRASEPSRGLVTT